MALYTPGPMVGSVSGGIGNTVFSRGRYGAILRIGAIPGNRITEYTVTARNRLSSLSKAWAALDPEERMSWETWAGQHPIVNRLGISQVLQGSAAFIQLNARILTAGGTQIDVPPIVGAPAPIGGTVALTGVAPSTSSLSWTSGKLAATDCLAVWGAVVYSKGRIYYKNLLKEIVVSAAEEETPLAIGTELNDRFGLLSVGSTIYLNCFVLGKTSGLLSGMTLASVVVSAP